MGSRQRLPICDGQHNFCIGLDMSIIGRYKTMLQDEIAGLNWRISERKAHTNDAEGIDEATLKKLRHLRTNLKTALKNL